MSFNRLFDVLKKVRDQYPHFSKRLEEAEALGRWEQAVGPAIAKHAKALRVKDGILWVEVDHPIWKTELHHRKRQILDVLNQGRPEDPESTPKHKKRKALAPAQEVLTDLFLVDPRGNQ